MSSDSLQFRVLDVLVNAPSSVAALYGDLLFLCGYKPSVLNPLRHALDDLEKRGWVIAKLMTHEGQFEQQGRDRREPLWVRYASWLPEARREDLAVDEIGLWYALTDAGRAAWNAWGGEPAAELWQLDDDPGASSITVTAETSEKAERVLQHWLDTNHERVLCRRTVSVRDVQLRNGLLIADGVQIVCSYLPGKT
jgi:hypothetical protein